MSNTSLPAEPKEQPGQQQPGQGQPGAQQGGLPQKNATEGARAAGAPLSVQLAGFVGESIVDGPGLRCVVFCQGCPHACPGCHNPATHPFAGGEVVTVAALLARIAANPLSRGVTLSGGEPFCQAEALAALCDALRPAGYEIAAYTGYTFEELLAGPPAWRALLSRLDILIDGRYEQAQRSLALRFRGSENQRILQVQTSLAAGAPVLETAPRWAGA